MPTRHTVRNITDSAVLAALAHPLRRRLMDVLKVHGPATVGMFAEHTDQASANVSHHLRVLGASGPDRGGAGAGPRPPRALVAAGHHRPAVEQRGLRRRPDRAGRGAGGTGRSTLDRHVQPGPSLVQRRRVTATRVGRQCVLHRPLASPDPGGTARGGGPRSWRSSNPGGHARRSPTDGQHREPVFVFAYGIPATP